MEKKQIGELCQKIHDNAVAHGWWEGGVKGLNLDEVLLLIVGEVSELHEAYRRNRLDAPCDKDTTPKLNCFQEEAADIVIRLLDLMGAYEVNPVTVSLWPKPMGGTFGAQLFFLVHEIAAMRQEADDYDVDDIGATLSAFGEEILSQVWVLCEANGYDLWECVEVKHAYNVTRPYRHGNLKA
jgi:hypothetical protein